MEKNKDDTKEAEKEVFKILEEETLNKRKIEKYAKDSISE
jgi:hypothetical protein